MFFLGLAFIGCTAHTAYLCSCWRLALASTFSVKITGIVKQVITFEDNVEPEKSGKEDNGAVQVQRRMQAGLRHLGYGLREKKMDSGMHK